MNAAKTIADAKTAGAQVGQGLDANALATRAGGVQTAGQALNAVNYAPNTVLNLDQQLKQMPLSDLSMYASLLLPAAGLGGQSTSQGTSNTTGTQFGVNLSSGSGSKVLGSLLGTIGL